MPTLPYGWITFQARGPVIKSKALNGSLSQAVPRSQLCHLGELSVGGERVSTPQHSKGPKTYATGLVTRMDIGAWRKMGACQECLRVYGQLPA
jgi:hypothetical protein